VDGATADGPTILSERSSLSPGKRLQAVPVHHQRSSRHAMVPLSDIAPTQKGGKPAPEVKMTEKRAETATPHLREAPEQRQQIEPEDAIEDAGKDGKHKETQGSANSGIFLTGCYLRPLQPGAPHTSFGTHLRSHSKPSLLTQLRPHHSQRRFLSKSWERVTSPTEL
jgi:hypothetical protein